MRMISREDLKQRVMGHFCGSCSTPYKDTDILELGEYCCDMVSDTMAFIDELPTIEAVPDNGWISVKDRLPDDKERYLICTEDGRIDIAYYQPIGDKFSDYEPFWQGSCRFTTSVTHWRTLPEPPKGE